MADSGKDRDEQSRQIVSRLIAGKPDDLDYVRTQIATGTVSHVLVDGMLAEIESMLQRADLRPLYRTLRDESATPTS